MKKSNMSGKSKKINRKKRINISNKKSIEMQKLKKILSPNRTAI